MNTVEVQGFSVVDGAGRRVLDPVDLVVPEGGSLALTGVSGSGKSTLARAVLGALRSGLHRASGTVRTLGVDVFSAPVRPVRRRVGFLGQDPAVELTPTLRVRDLVPDPAVLRSLGLPDDDDFGRRFPRELSGGQCRRVALASRLVRRPELLILDEPTAGLDRRSIVTVVAELRAARSAYEGALLIVTHDLEVAAELADDRVHLGGAAARSGTRGVVTDAPGEVVLAVRGMSVRHDGPDLVEGLGFELRQGQALALTGPSGIGKSTVARALVGVHPLTAGTLERDPDPLAVQLVPQDTAGTLNPALRVATTLRRALRRSGSPGSVDEISRLLERVGLSGDLARKRPGRLSGGQRQRVALARALAGSPRVLVCDEVTAALDDASRDVVLDLLDDLRRDGVALVVITHDRVVVDRLCTEELALGVAFSGERP